MESALILSYLIEFSFVLSIFFIALIWAVLIGRQSVINLIIGTYLALALFNLFPYLDFFTAKVGSQFYSNLLTIFIFVTFVIGGFFLTRRVSPAEYRENKFESFPKKILLASALTILILVISLSILPVSSVLSAPLEMLGFFTKPELTFWWMILPLGLVAIN